MNLSLSLEHHARVRPAAPAIIAGTHTLTHREFRDAVVAMAAGLVEDGVLAGHRVGVALPDSIEHLVMMFALARIGAVMVPLDHRWTAVEHNRVTLHFKVRRVFDSSRPPPTASVASTASTIAPGGAAPLLLSLSSGTTGRPKGPVVTHDQFLARFRTHWIHLGFNSRSRYVAATPLYFGGGRTFAMSVLFAGGAVVLAPPPLSAQEIAAEIERVGATSAFMVPTQLRQLLDAPTALRERLSSLKLLISSGAPLTRTERAAIKQHLCAGFYEYYASTEGGGISLLAPNDQDQHGDSVGRAIYGVSVEVVDAQHRVLPLGEVGRLRYRGSGCVTAFDNDPDASLSSFHDGWFYPGDLASVDTQGFITLAGRGDDVIIRGGVNIYPAEIEAALREHPDVADVAVCGIAHRTRGEDIAAVCVLRAPLTGEVLKQWAADRLAPYKRPGVWVVVNELPRNAGGKVNRMALREQVAKLS